MEEAPIIDEAPIPSPPAMEEEAPVIEEVAASPEPEAVPEAPAASDAKEKSPEDLLSEFEKMLG